MVTELNISPVKRASVDRTNQLRDGRQSFGEVGPLVEVSPTADGRDEDVVQT